MKRILIMLMVVACAVACTPSEATKVADTGGSAPVQLTLEDVTPNMEVCAHQGGRRWDAEITGTDIHDGVNFISIRESLPGGVEEGSFMAAGYGLEAETRYGDIGSIVRLSAGHCTEDNDLGPGDPVPSNDEPFVLNFDEAGIGMQVCVDHGNNSVNGVITNLYFENEAEMVSIDIEDGDPLVSEMAAVHMTLGYCS